VLFPFQYIWLHAAVVLLSPWRDWLVLLISVMHLIVALASTPADPVGHGPK
jgi:hypothetical protein